MDALQVISSATQIVSSMVGAVGALEQASRNLDEAPMKIRSLEEFVCELEKLTQQIKQKHIHKLHNPQLEHQIQSLNGLIERLHPNIRKARRIVSKSRIKNIAKVVWISVAGDPLSKIVDSVRNDLNWWLESQTLTGKVQNIVESTAKNVRDRMKINTDQGYPVSSKCKFVSKLLEQENCHQVVLIVGLSGIGKSCLARQVASNPPSKFVDGAVELSFGQWCSKAACNGSKVEYQKRLSRKFCRFLVQIGYWKKINDQNSEDLVYICCVLQEALSGKNILILLDDVWEQDIVERFTKLYNNNCRYLVTTRNESVYEITEAKKVELSEDDVKEISKSILLYHSLLKEEELPGVAETLLDRCGHHPLTLAVMGKALRKETRAEKWEKALINLSTYATCAPGPVSYVNEKEAENTLTVFGSFEFSLEAMPEDSRTLFVALAALSWAEPLPEACIEAVWSVLGHESLFPLIVCKLVEGSLLTKSESYDLYQVHDMVSLYLDGKMNDAIKILLTESNPEMTAFISPWLFFFGKEKVKKVSQEKIEFLLTSLEENLVIITLEGIMQALMASISMPELEASRAGFSAVLGTNLVNLIGTDSQKVIGVSAKAITNIFSDSDYCKYFPNLESIGGTVDKLSTMIEDSEDPTVQTSVSIVLAKLAEFGSSETVNTVLQRFPMSQLADLLSLQIEESHESIFTTLMSLIQAGKVRAVEKMFACEIDKKLIEVLDTGSEVAQHHAIIMLKAFYELKGRGSLKEDTLIHLPWQARVTLEKFVLKDRNIHLSPKPQTFEDLMHALIDGDRNQVLEAMQNLIPVIETAGDLRIREMILKGPLVKRLSELLQYGPPEENSLRSESAFALMKLACSGGEPCIKKFLEYNIVPELVKMMQCNVTELQDSAYSALHQILFTSGSALVLNRILQMGLIDKLVLSMESKSAKTREVSVLFLLDIVEVGNRTSLERMISLQVVEKLVRIEKGTGGSGKTVVGFIKGMDKCKNLSVAERRLMKQQVVRKVRTALRGHKFEAQIIAAVDACASEGSKGGSSSGSSGKHKK